MIARLRLWSGVLLFVYATMHLLNHAAGLVSIGAMAALLEWSTLIWRGWPGTVALASAFAVHVALVLWSLFRRRRLRLSAWEWCQVALGVAIVPLGAIHVVATRVAYELYAVEAGYPWVLWSMLADPWSVARQYGLVLVVWVHGCVGLHFLFRLKAWYRALVPWVYAVALLLPALAIAGVSVALREMAAYVADPDRRAEVIGGFNVPTAADVAFLYELADIAKIAGLCALMAVLLARPLRDLWNRRAGSVRLHYAGDKSVTAPVGLTVLEISRVNGVPHASVCGGRGRCSTCRIRIVGPDSHRLPAASAEESRVLARFGAPDNVRLACQLRPPSGEYRVTPLMPASAQPADAYRNQSLAMGGERVIAILFADLRGYTAFSEKRLPYDVVFILNRYFRAVGEAIEGAGGHVDKFIGDGVMAIFGARGDGPTAARQALDAARRIAHALDAFNAALGDELAEPLRIGIGLHCGASIVGEMGYGRATSLTAIGDAVNTASRLESMTKEHGAQLIVSQELVDLAGVRGDMGEPAEVAVRGREDRIRVRIVKDASTLAVSFASVDIR